MLDNELVMSDKQAVTATAVSADKYYAGSQAVNLGAGEPIEFAVHVVEDFATLTSLEVQIIGADNEALTTNPVVIESSGAIPVASLKAGTRQFRGKLNPSSKKQYYGFKYVVDGSNATAGKVTAYMGKGIPEQAYYNKNYQVHLN